MSNKTTLQDNNLELSIILGDINALPNAGGGGGAPLETCQLLIHQNGNILTQQCIPYIDGNGKLDFITGGCELEGVSDISLTVPKNAVMMLNVTPAQMDFAVGASNFENITDYMNVSWTGSLFFYKITGDVELTIDY